MFIYYVAFSFYATHFEEKINYKSKVFVSSLQFHNSSYVRLRQPRKGFNTFSY